MNGGFNRAPLRPLVGKDGFSHLVPCSSARLEAGWEGFPLKDFQCNNT